MSIYVETWIRGDIDQVWEYTQSPDLHQRWDLRFTEISYVPRESDGPQRFSYATRLGFGLRINGKGESVGERVDEATRTSSLKFWSDDAKSLIREGSGYWRYEQTDGGTRFGTGYDYKPRFGVVGKAFDTMVFRPLLAWATAWSFDALRIWIEAGIPPEVSRRSVAIYGVARAALALGWIYQGVVPKLLFPANEMLTLQGVKLPMDTAQFIRLSGWIETLAGLALLVLWRSRWLLQLQSLVLIVLALGAAISFPSALAQSFGPIPLTISMVALGAVALIAGKDMPSARRCKRRKDS